MLIMDLYELENNNKSVRIQWWKSIMYSLKTKETQMTEQQVPALVAPLNRLRRKLLRSLWCALIGDGAVWLAF